MPPSTPAASPDERMYQYIAECSVSLHSGSSRMLTNPGKISANVFPWFASNQVGMGFSLGLTGRVPHSSQAICSAVSVPRVKAGDIQHPAAKEVASWIELSTSLAA